MMCRLMKKAAVLAVCIAMVLTAVPAVHATSQDQNLSAQGEVIVLFRDGEVEDNDMSLRSARSMSEVGSGFGMSLNATGDADEAAGTVESETAILEECLGEGSFILEDSIVFPAAEGTDEESENGLELDSDTLSDGEGELNIALVSSDKYDTETLIDKLSGNSRIAAAEPNYEIYDQEYDDYALNDTYASYLYQVNSPLADNTAGDDVDTRGEMPEQPYDSVSTNAASAWKKLDGSEHEVVVAVVDTGIDPEHEDLANMLWTNPGNIGLKGEHGYNFGDDNTDIRDHNGHGTHCCGIIAAQANNSKGIAGVASGTDVKIMMLKKNADSSSSSRLYVAIGAFSYALRAKEAGVNIVAVSNSWGRNDTESTIFNEIIDRMGEAGILTFCAAGNAAKNLDRAVDNPASNESEYSITVGCAGIDGQPAGFSNYGKSQVDIFAPGLNILSTVGDKTYFPSLYDQDELDRTTAYYGGFSSAAKISDDGSVTPEKGKGGDDVSTFGASVFRVQKSGEYVTNGSEEDEDPEEDDDSDDEDEKESGAECELSIEPSHYFTMGENAASLKVTIKNAVLGDEYFLYFPYEKDPLSEGEGNTWFSIYYENGETEDISSCEIAGGDVVEEEDGTVSLYRYGYEGYGTAGINRYTGSHISTPEDRGNMNKLIPYEELSGRKVGLGLQIIPEQMSAESWSDGMPHDVTIYLDHIAVSRPGAAIGADSSYEMMSGTSMACPAAAGAGALIAALYPKEEGQSGSDYSLMIKNRFLSCAHQTDALEDKCQTGGYIDLSLLDKGQPVIRDALCDLRKDTITLKGSGLFSGNRLTYRRVYVSNAEEVEILENNDAAGGIAVEYAADGSEALIKNARALFGTYTEFTYSDRSSSGKATFFLVKGQKKIEMAASMLQPNPAESDYDEEKENERYLMSDSDGSKLFGIERNNGTISRFDGEQFVDIPGTRIKDAVRAWLEDQGYDRYQVTGEFSITTYIDVIPWHSGDMVYAPVSAVYESGPEDTGNGDGQSDDEAGDHEAGYEDEDDDQVELYYLASLDLSEKKPSWTFQPFTDPEVYAPFQYRMAGNILYAFAAEEDDGCSVLYSYDLSDAPDERRWQREQDLPEVKKDATLASYKGRLYAFFGSGEEETGKHEDEQLRDSVWRFDGSEWSMTGTLAFAGKYSAVYGSDPEFIKCPVEVGNGLVFVDCSVDGLGNTFLYDPDKDKGTPLYYTINDSLSDDTVSGEGSAAVTRDGIYYMRDHSDEMRRGWAVYRIPESDGAYESPFPVKKLANTIKVSGASRTVRYARLKKKAVTVKAIKVKKAAGKAAYRKVSVNKRAARFTVDKKSGKITIKKGTRTGTYRIKVRVTAAGNDKYKAGSRTVTVKIKIK